MTNMTMSSCFWFLFFLFFPSSTSSTSSGRSRKWLRALDAFCLGRSLGPRRPRRPRWRRWSRWVWALKRHEERKVYDKLIKNLLRCPTLGFLWTFCVNLSIQPKMQTISAKSELCCTGLERPFKTAHLIGKSLPIRFRPPGSQRPSIASVASLCVYVFAEIYSKTM